VGDGARGPCHELVGGRGGSWIADDGGAKRRLSGEKVVGPTLGGLGRELGSDDGQGVVAVAADGVDGPTMAEDCMGPMAHVGGRPGAPEHDQGGGAAEVMGALELAVELGHETVVGHQTRADLMGIGGRGEQTDHRAEDELLPNREIGTFDLGTVQPSAVGRVEIFDRHHVASTRETRVFPGQARVANDDVGGGGAAHHDVGVGLERNRSRSVAMMQGEPEASIAFVREAVAGEGQVRGGVGLGHGGQGVGESVMVLIQPCST
jgi:hypothetical protein